MSTSASPRRIRTGTVAGWSKQNALFFGVILLIVYFSFASESFLSGANVEVILLNVAIVGLVAVPGAMLVLSGYVDLSVGSVAVLSSVVFGKAFEAGAPAGVCFLAALAVGATWGLIQGALVTYGGLSPIVVTLGGFAGLRGFALYLSDAFVVQDFGSPTVDLGGGYLLGVPVPVVIFFAAFAIGGYLWYATPLGRHMTAIGADHDSAHALGIATKRIPLLLYVASGLAGSLGGLILMSQLDATSLSIGEGLEISVLTAILLGGVSFVGGRGSLFGVFMGVLFIGIIQNGLLLVNVSAYLVSVVIGLALIGAAALDVLYKRVDRFVEPEESIGAGADSLLAPPRVDELPLVSPVAGERRPTPGVPLLDVRNLSKSFGAVRAVHDVSFTVEPGEVVGLVGDNGAGKSTLVSMLAGVEPPDSGEVHIDGSQRALHSPADAQAAGIETVFQSLALVPTLDISENVFLNREAFHGGFLRGLRFMDRGTMRTSVGDSFTRLNLRLPSATTKVAGLSGGQRQAVAIARAVLWGSRVVILDEPAAALGVRQTEIVLQFIEQLKQHDIAVILISHNMQHVMRVADRVIVMRLGEKAFDGPRAGLEAEDLVAMLTGARTFDEPVTGGGSAPVTAG